MKTMKYFVIGAMMLSMSAPAMAQDVKAQVDAITKVVVDAKGDVAATKAQVKEFMKLNKKDAEAVADDDDSDTDKDKDEDKHDDKSAELRYDGIYVRIYDWKEDGLLDTRAIRFYPDGYLIQASLAQTSKSDYLMPNAETFTRETYTTITG